MLSPVVVNTIRGKRKGQVTTLPGAKVGDGERHHQARVRVSGDSAEEAGADAPVRRFRRNNAVNLGVEVEQVAVGVSNSANAEVEDEVGEEVGRKRKQKRKSRENVEDIVVAAQVGVPRRSTRSSGPLLAAPFVSSPVVEKKRGRRKARGVKEQTCVEEQLAEVQDLGRTLRSGLVMISTVLPVVVETKRSRRLVQEEEPAVQKVAKVEISGSTRSRSAAAAVMSPIAVENKRRKTEDAHSDGELPTVLKVPTNNAPVARVLRTIAVQVNNNVVEETHFGKILKNKRQPSRPATRSRRHQHLASSVEKNSQDQVAVPFKGRQSRRNHSEASELLLNNETTLESNNAAKVSVEDNVRKADGHLELRKRNPHNGAKGCGSAEEQVVGVVVRKGCLKWSSGSSGPAKKVTFVLEKHAEVDSEVGVRGTPWVTWSPVFAKTRGRRNAQETLPVAEISGGERQLTHVRVGGDSVSEGDAREAGANAPVRRSRRNAVNLGAGDGAKKVAGSTSRNNSTNADKEEEDVGEAVDKKQKTGENSEDVVISSEVGVSSVLLSKAAFLWSLLLGRTDDRGRQEM